MVELPEVSSRTGLRSVRLVGEALAIVASILIAFGIDAAWDSRSERIQVRESLSAVRDELVRSRESLVEVWLPWHTSIATASMAVLWRVESDSDFPDVSPPRLGREEYREFVSRFAVPLGQTPERSGRIVSIPDSLLAAVIFTPTYDPMVVSLLALTAGGRISAVENRPLREALPSLPAILDDLAAEEAVALDQVRMDLMPSLSTSASLTHVRTISGVIWLSRWSDSPPIIPDEVFFRSTKVAIDLRLGNALASRVFLAYSVVVSAWRLEELLDEVLTLLNAEIR